jgi:anti-sigma factor RsiW
MKCEDVSKELIAYLDRRASSAERSQVEEHLNGCVVCRTRAEEFRRLWTVMDQVPTIEPSFGFDARLRARVAEEPRPRWLGWLVPQPRLAFSLAMLLAVGVWMAKLPPAVDNATAKTQDFEAIKDLGVLENYDVLTKFDALSELPTSAPDSNAPSQDPMNADDGGGS